MRENGSDAPLSTRGLETPALEELQAVDNFAQNSPGARKRKKPLSPFQESMQAFRGDIRAMISLGILLLFVLLAIIGPPIYQHIGSTYPADLGGTVGPTAYHSYDHEELTQQNQGPSARYWLGTDPLGRAMLARLMQCVLASLIVALLVEVVDIAGGMRIGVLAGYHVDW